MASYSATFRRDPSVDTFTIPLEEPPREQLKALTPDASRAAEAMFKMLALDDARSVFGVQLENRLRRLMKQYEVPEEIMDRMRNCWSKVGMLSAAKVVYAAVCGCVRGDYKVRKLDLNSTLHDTTSEEEEAAGTAEDLRAEFENQKDKIKIPEVSDSDEDREMESRYADARKPAAWIQGYDQFVTDWAEGTNALGLLSGLLLTQSSTGLNPNDEMNARQLQWLASFRRRNKNKDL